MIPREYVENYTKALNAVSEQSRAGLRAALEAIDYNQDVATIREQVDAIMQTWCGGATDMAATLAAEFYDGLREYGNRRADGRRRAQRPRAGGHDRCRARICAKARGR